MSYQPRPTASGDTLAASRDPIRNNFSLIQTSLELNHGAFGAADQGKHKFMQMPEQGSAPTTAANEVALYAKQDPNAPGEAAIFYRQEGSGNEYQITTSHKTNLAQFGLSNPGWTFLPGGLLMQYGTYTQASSSGGTAVVFPTPFAATPYAITLELNRDSGTDASTMIKALSATGFTGRSTASGSHTAYYIAIGKA